MIDYSGYWNLRYLTKSSKVSTSQELMASTLAHAKTVINTTLNPVRLRVIKLILWGIDKHPRLLLIPSTGIEGLDINSIGLSSKSSYHALDAIYGGMVASDGSIVDTRGQGRSAST